jgi:opacity protein-like surface antigen
MIPSKTPSFLLLLASTLILISSFAGAQTSVALSGYGAFSGTTTGNGTQQSPANQAGGMVEVRHISNPIMGFEATYSYNRADETYSPYGAFTNVCPGSATSCGPPATVQVPANAHEITGDWTPSVHIANVRPFGVLGVGVLLNVPAGSEAETSTSTKAVYVYGAGLDWELLSHIGLRLQYRGNLYEAPNLSKLYTSTDAFTHTAEPMIGVYFRL